MTRSFFHWAAPGYDLMTDQELWRREAERMLAFAPLPLHDGLDLGCGPGVSTLGLARARPGVRWTGLDRELAMVERARRHLRRHAGAEQIEFRQGDARALPFDAGCFDLVVGHSFLYLVPERDRVLREARRVLRPGGRVVFMEPSATGSLRQALRAGYAGFDATRHRPWDAARFATSIALWRVSGLINGRISPEHVIASFEAAGLRNPACFSTLAGMGLHCVAEG